MPRDLRHGPMNAGRDQGVTLVELLIVVVVMGTIAFALASVFTAIVRTTPPTEARADDARSLLGISTWLPADVSSTPMAPVSSADDHWDKEPRVSGCSGGNGGNSVLWLSWRENLGGAPVTFVANYRLVEENSVWTLKRVTCRIGTAPQINNVTAGLPPASETPITVTWKLNEANTMIIGVEFLIRTNDGDILRVDATSRNPAETLSTIPESVTTTSSSTTTTTTSTTTTTTLAPDPSDPVTTTESPTTTEETTTTTVPCSANFASIVPNPVANEPGSSGSNLGSNVGPLAQPVNVTINRSGNCSGLVLRYRRVVTDSGGASFDPDRALQIRVFGDSIVVTLLAIPTERWEKGNRNLELFDTQSNTLLATSILVVI